MEGSGINRDIGDRGEYIELWANLLMVIAFCGCAFLWFWSIG